MSFTTSRLQQMRALMSHEIRSLQKSCVDAKSVIDTTLVAIDSGVYDDPVRKAVVVQTIHELRRDIRYMRSKSVLLGDIQKMVKKQLNENFGHMRNVVSDVADIVAVASATPILGLFTDEALVGNLIALSDLQHAA